MDQAGPSTSDATFESPQENPPPFSPEQLVWIDRLIANCQGQSSVASNLTPAVDPISTSAAALITPASQPGEFMLACCLGLSVAYCYPARGRVCQRLPAEPSKRGTPGAYGIPQGPGTDAQRGPEKSRKQPSSLAVTVSDHWQWAREPQLA